MVTPAILGFIADGAFSFPAADWRLTSPERRDSLLAVSATELLSFRPQRLEEEHGGPIAWAELRPCGRRYFVHSPIAPLSPLLPLVYRQAFAHFWVGTLCNAALAPQVTVTLSDGESLLQIESGRFHVPWSNNAELDWFGVYPIGDRGLPVSPEQAAVFVAGTLGTRVAAIPEGWRWYPHPAPTPYPAQCILWKITLANARDFLDAFNQPRSSTEVYVGRFPACARGELSFWLPSYQSPAIVVPVDTGGTGYTLVALPLTAPIYFERVRAAGSRPRQGH